VIRRMCIAHGTTSIRHLLGVCFNMVYKKYIDV